MALLSGPPRRGLTLPIAATFACAASRACTTGMRSTSGTPSGAPSGYRARTRARTSRSSAASSSALRASSSAGATLFAPGSGDGGLQPAARREAPDHGGGDGLARLHHVLKKAVHHVLVEDAEAAVSQRVHFERLQFQAKLIRHVVQRDRPEIRQAGLGAHGGELRNGDFDFVAGVLVRPRLDAGKVGVNARAGVRVGVGTNHWQSKAPASKCRNSPTSVTTPTACPVPRSLTFVATAGLISTQTIFTQLGSMLPVAMECSMEPRHSTSPAPFNCSAYASCATFMSVMVSGSGPSSRRLPANTNGTPCFTHSYSTPEVSRPDSTEI